MDALRQTSHPTWPRGSDAGRLSRLASRADGPLRVVLDTDAFNEIDDQFAIVHTALAEDRVRLEAVCAAPFVGDGAATPAEGMERSFEEILRLFERLPVARPPVLRGSDQWLTQRQTGSETAEWIIDSARRQDAGTLYVVAIGAPTNVANALLQAPEIAEQMVVVWLGSNPSYLPFEPDFNSEQDQAATAAVLDSGVPLVLVPCLNVSEHLRTTHAEIDRYVRPASSIGSYLADIFHRSVEQAPGRSKEIWDLAATAWVINPRWTTSSLRHAPWVTADGRWVHGDNTRHLVHVVDRVDRDAIFTDLFARLGPLAGRGDVSR